MKYIAIWRRRAKSVIFAPMWVILRMVGCVMLLAGFLLSFNACLHIKLWVYELLTTEESFGPFCKTGYEEIGRGMSTGWVAPNEIPNPSKSPQDNRKPTEKRQAYRFNWMEVVRVNNIPLRNDSRARGIAYVEAISGGDFKFALSP